MDGIVPGCKVGPPRMQNGGNMKVSHHPGGDGCNPAWGKTSQGVCIFLSIYLHGWLMFGMVYVGLSMNDLMG